MLWYIAHYDTILAYHRPWFILMWLNIMWSRHLCMYLVLYAGTWHTIWIKFYISHHYHSTQFAIISKLQHITWCCHWSMYLHILMYCVVYYMGLYSMLTFKLCYSGTSLVVILSSLLPPCSNEMNTVFFAWCTILYCIFHDFSDAIGYHLLLYYCMSLGIAN